MLTNAFSYLSNYIGGLGVIFIETLLFIIIFRILLAFIFKILRLNIDYHALNSKNKTRTQHDKLEKYSDKSLFD